MLHILRLTRPTTADFVQSIQACARQRFTYEAVGLTQQHQTPEGFLRIHRREVIGQGEQDFARACEAVERLEMFRLGWTFPGVLDPGLEPGAHLTMGATLLGLWVATVGRVVYVERHRDQQQERFGFGFGTLPRHVLAGEERFAVGWEKASGQVWFEIESFSRPVRPEAWLALPVVRGLQRRFGRHAVRAMRRYVQAQG